MSELERQHASFKDAEAAKLRAQVDVSIEALEKLIESKEHGCWKALAASFIKYGKFVPDGNCSGGLIVKHAVSDADVRHLKARYPNIKFSVRNEVWEDRMYLFNITADHYPKKQ